MQLESNVNPMNETKNLREKITELEQRSRLLETSSEEYERWLQ